MTEDRFSPRVARIRPSPSAMTSKRARELIAAGVDVIDLSPGDPDFATSAHVLAAAASAMERGETHYTAPDGTHEVKRAVQTKFERDNGLRFALDEIIVGAGGKPLIYNALAATLAPGDEVVIPAPYWVSFPDMVLLNDGVPRIIGCAAEEGFKLAPHALDAAIGPRTRWLVLNSPNNPSGAVYREAELEAIAAVLARHERVWILCDEVYERIVFEDHDAPSLAKVAPALRPRILIVNSVSKSYAMTGWRIGYAAGSRELIKRMAAIQSQTASGPCSISQAAATAALTGPQEEIDERRAELRQRRDLVVEQLRRIPGLDCHMPEGAIFAFPSCTGLINSKAPDGRLIANDADLALYLLDTARVAVVPGAAYGLSPYFRLDLGHAPARLAEACARLDAACRALARPSGCGG